MHITIQRRDAVVPKTHPGAGVDQVQRSRVREFGSILDSRHGLLFRPEAAAKQFHHVVRYLGLLSVRFVFSFAWCSTRAA